MHQIKLIRAVLCSLLISLTACTSMIPRADLPYPLTNKGFGDPVKVVTIPLPVIASSPNEGVTSGALTSFLLHNRNDEVSTLLAPQVNFNSAFGTTFTLYGAFYPTPDRSWEMNLSKSTKINSDISFKLRDKTFLDRKLELNAVIFRFADASARFFGFSAKSPRQRETNYTDAETGFNLSAGYDLGNNFQLVAGERFRDVTIRKGAFNKLPFIQNNTWNGSIPGSGGFTTHAQRLSLVYSSLDSRDMPTSGGYARATVEMSKKVLGSSADFNHYEAEAKGYFPLADSRYITVLRLVYNQTQGEDVPFLEQSILGGETSLRGYGRNRFIDNSFLLCNIEERIRLFRWSVFDVNTDWELAPFIDLGAVMSSLDNASTRNFEFNPGIGFRAVVRPNIVGRVDIGFGKDGPAVFVGLGYPF